MGGDPVADVETVVLEADYAPSPSALRGPPALEVNYAQPVTRIATLTKDDVIDRDGEVFLSPWRRGQPTPRASEHPQRAVD